MHARDGTVIRGPERRQSPRTVGKPGEEEDEEGNVEEEGIEEEELVSSQDMEHSVIVVAPQR
jgi:hypothetical protein